MLTGRTARSFALEAWLLLSLAACAPRHVAEFQGPPAPATQPATQPADGALLAVTLTDPVGAGPRAADAGADGEPGPAAPRAAAGPVEVAEPEGRDAHLPPTRLALDSFSDGMLVVLGRTQSTTNVGLGSAVARVLVEEQLAGPDLAGSPELVVLAYAGDLVRGRRELLFLRPFRGGPRWSVEHRLDSRDPDFRAKLEMTRRTAGLLAVRQPRAREAATFELILDALGDRRDWTRRYAVAELGWLASTRADLFSELRMRRLEALAAETPHLEVRLGVESVAIVLSRRSEPLPGAPSQESSRP